MNETASLVFKPDGTVVGLYSELIDLTTLGRLSVKRVSRIEFEENGQVWRVRDRRGFPLFTAPTRRQCLQWEELYMNDKLERDAT